jgi:hypothetical protein
MLELKQSHPEDIENDEMENEMWQVMGGSSTGFDVEKPIPYAPAKAVGVRSSKTGMKLGRPKKKVDPDGVKEEQPSVVKKGKRIKMMEDEGLDTTGLNEAELADIKQLKDLEKVLEL